MVAKWHSCRRWTMRGLKCPMSYVEDLEKGDPPAERPVWPKFLPPAKRQKPKSQPQGLKAYMSPRTAMERYVGGREKVRIYVPKDPERFAPPYKEGPKQLPAGVPAMVPIPVEIGKKRVKVPVLGGSELGDRRYPTVALGKSEEMAAAATAGGRVTVNGKSFKESLGGSQALVLGVASVALVGGIAALVRGRTGGGGGFTTRATFNPRQAFFRP